MIMAKFAAAMQLFGALALAAVPAAAPALAQGFDIRNLFNSMGASTGSVPAPPAQPYPASGGGTGGSATPEWSGESGSSGHPAMTAPAIRAAAADFRNCLAGLWPEAERRGIARAVFDANVAGL